MIALLEIEAGSLRYSRADNSAIDCRARFSHLPDELVPFTATEDDPQPHAQEVWAALQLSGDVLPYVAPTVSAAETSAALVEDERQSAKDEAAALASAGDFKAAFVKLLELI